MKRLNFHALDITAFTNRALTVICADSSQSIEELGPLIAPAVLSPGDIDD